MELGEELLRPPEVGRRVRRKLFDSVVEPTGTAARSRITEYPVSQDRAGPARVSTDDPLSDDPTGTSAETSLSNTTGQAASNSNPVDGTPGPLCTASDASSDHTRAEDRRDAYYRVPDSCDPLAGPTADMVSRVLLTSSGNQVYQDHVGQSKGCTRGSIVSTPRSGRHKLCNLGSELVGGQPRRIGGGRDSGLPPSFS